MGEGRNALYLAKLGWSVAGFDPAADAVALAQRRARDLGLKLATTVVRDADYDFGAERFDLILLSWASTTPELIPKLLAALKPGGFIVFEAAADWFPRNGLPELFDAFRIVRYEVVTGKSDFFNRAEMEIVRLQARKP
jgi:SAM-dependent methyltransferase